LKLRSLSFAYLSSEILVENGNLVENAIIPPEPSKRNIYEMHPKIFTTHKLSTSISKGHELDRILVRKSNV